MIGAPCYWMHETSGVLRPVIEAYLSGGPMSEEQIVILRSYIEQWIYAPVWTGDAAVVDLRERAGGLTTRKAIAAWLDDADELGIDPL